MKNQNVKQLVKNHNNIIYLIEKTLFLGCLIFFSIFSNAQSFNFSKGHINSYQQILALKLPLANKKLETLPTNNGITFYLKSLSSSILILLENDETAYEEWLDQYDDAIDIVEKYDKTSPYYLFTLSEIKLHAAFLKFYFGDRMNAFWHFRSAYNLLKENHKKFPTFLPNKKSLGCLNILLGSVPNEYTWIMNGLGFYGDINKGLGQLAKIQESNSLFKLEVDCSLLLIKSSIFKEKKESLTMALALKKKYPDNLLIHFIHSSYLQKMNQNELLLESFKSYPPTINYAPFPYLAIMHGDALLQKGLYKDAIKQYEKFIEENKGAHYLKHVYYHLFMAYQLQEKTEKATYFLNKCMTEGSTLIDTDKHANKFVNQEKIPHNSLIKARLFSDGGYYSQAINCLKDSSIYTNHEDLLDFYYRKGRIYHKINEHKTAIFYYKKVIILTKESDYSYFAPNSCLQLAYIYQESKNNQLAKSYFQKALNYEKHEYKNSIDHKAKVGLSQLPK